LSVYKATKSFPKEEMFCLTSQIRRAVISISSNIAEGFSRNSVKDKCKFYTIALGSLTELQNQLLIGRDLKYLAENDFQNVAQQTVRVSKLISGLKKIKNSI